MREEIAHLLALGIPHAHLRVARHSIVELPAHGDDETAAIQEAVVRAARYRIDIGPVDFPELTFHHAIQAGQRISRQPTAVAGQDVEERPQRACHDGDVRPGTRRTGYQFLPCLADVRPQWCPRRFYQRPQTRLIFRRRDPELTLVCRHGRILAGRPELTAGRHIHPHQIAHLRAEIVAKWSHSPRQKRTVIPGTTMYKHTGSAAARRAITGARWAANDAKKP